MAMNTENLITSKSVFSYLCDGKHRDGDGVIHLNNKKFEEKCKVEVSFVFERSCINFYITSDNEFKISNIIKNHRNTTICTSETTEKLGNVDLHFDQKYLVRMLRIVIGNTESNIVLEDLCKIIVGGVSYRHNPRENLAIINEILKIN